MSCFSNFISIDLSFFFSLIFWNFSNFWNSELRWVTEGNELLRADDICPNFAKIGNNLIKETTYNDNNGKTFSTCVFDIKIINIKTIETKITSNAELGIAWIKLIFLLEFSKIWTLLVKLSSTLFSFLEILISLIELRLCKIHLISEFLELNKFSPNFLSFWKIIKNIKLVKKAKLKQL